MHGVHVQKIASPLASSDPRRFTHTHTHARALTSLLQQTYRDTHEETVPLVLLWPDGRALVVTTSVCTSVCVCVCVCVCVILTPADAMGSYHESGAAPLATSTPGRRSYYNVTST